MQISRQANPERRTVSACQRGERSGQVTCHVVLVPNGNGLDQDWGLASSGRGRARSHVVLRSEGLAIHSSIQPDQNSNHQPHPILRDATQPTKTLDKGICMSRRNHISLFFDKVILCFPFSASVTILYLVFIILYEIN